MELDYGDIIPKQRLLVNMLLYDRFQNPIIENGIYKYNYNPKVKITDTDLYDIKIKHGKLCFCFNENFNDWFEYVYQNSLTQELVDNAKLELEINNSKKKLKNEN